LYIAAIKAQRLKADFVVVISTRDISVNVQERIADFNAQRRNGDDRFVAITSPSASELERQLLNLLDEWTEQHVQNWLIGSRDLFYFGTEP